LYGQKLTERQVPHVSTLNRWTKIPALLAALALVLTACGGAQPAAQPTAMPAEATAMPAATEAPAEATAMPAATEAPAEATAMPAAEGGKLEIFSWWTNGGEADGLNAMYEIFKQQNPGVEIVNATVAGGAGTNAKTVLKTRLQGGQPPDSWQVHAGKELTSYVDAGQMEPLTAFFQEQGFDKVMPPKLLEQITYNGEIYSVPVNVHRSNVLWYNLKVFSDNGLTPPKTMDEFFTVAETLKGKGIIPLAVGGKDKFETPHLFESVLLATFGPEEYAALFQAGATWDDPRITEAAETARRMLEYSNSDRSSLGWADAAQLVLDGKAAMTIMGDWAHGYFLSKGATVGTDYGYAAAPGNDGVFMWLSDSFGLAKGAPNPDQARAWLALCGSREGQDAFNPKKGSIPARTDADTSLYDEYLQYSIKAFGSEQLAPSVVHGAAAPEAYMTSYGNALNVFAADLDVETLVQALQDAAVDLK
jgi:glucose/mannose transport system substrate-binding protein